jgi:putative endonuclease
MTLHRTTLGKTGEDLACRELRRRGYAILARRYRTRIGEIDIVARDGETVAFVEVRTRAGDRFGSASESVTAAKRQRVCEMAADYVARMRLEGRPCRFDVVSISMAGARPIVEVIRGAFDASGT